MGDSKETVSSRIDTRTNSPRLRQHAQVQAMWDSSAQKGKWTLAPTPNQEAICNGLPRAKENLVFSNKASLSTLTMLKAGPTLRPTQNELSDIFV